MATSAVRLRDRRGRLRGERPGEPPLDRPREPRAGAGGRPARLHLGRLHPHAGGAAVPDREPVLRLEVRVGARAAYGRAADLPRPREGPRRLQQHQRHDLPARQPHGLRALGRRPGHGDVGLRALPAVLQADGALHGRRPRGRVPRPRGTARRGARARPEPALRRVLRGGAAGGLPAHRRRERVPPGRVRPVRPQHPERASPVRGPRVPAPGHEPTEPRRRDPGVRHEGPVPGRPGRGRGVLASPGTGEAGDGGRGHPVRRRDQLAAVAAAVGRGERG